MLQAKADQKLEFVQAMIRQLEKAMKNYNEEDQLWLRNLIDPDDKCVFTLVKLVIEPKYREFISLRCVVLRALQIILRVAQSMVQGPLQGDANVGRWCLVHLVGPELANQAISVVVGMANHEQIEPVASCNALLVLAELGPEVLAPELTRRLMDLFVRLPDRAEDLVEVGLRFHAQGGQQRAALLDAAVSHPGGSLLCEVLLQVINRADMRRRLRALKVLSGCLSRPSSERLLYTNDVRVLVEILLRELPNHAEDATAFAAYADCFKVVASIYAAARTHRRSETLQVFEDLCEDERLPSDMREKCREVLQVVVQPT